MGSTARTQSTPPHFITRLGAGSRVGTTWAGDRSFGSGLPHGSDPAGLCGTDGDPPSAICRERVASEIQQRKSACFLRVLCKPKGGMRRAVVCFANVQEGRDPKLLREIASAATSVPGASLVRMFSDRTFHRSGLCVVGGPEAVGDAVFALVKTALARINLIAPDRLSDPTIHHHIGAVDLLPFHPVGAATMEHAAQTSRTVAERVGRELGVPVLTYGAAVSSTPSCSARSAKRTCASF